MNEISELEEFHKSLVADVQGDADALGLYTQEAFFEKIGEILTEAGEIDQCDFAHFEGRSSVSLEVTGSGGDPLNAGGVLSLILCDFKPTSEVRVIRGAELKGQFKKLVEFLKYSRKAEFWEGREETSLGAGLADLIRTRWKNIDKVKLIIVTNACNRSRVDAKKVGTIDEKPTTYNVWDLKRLQDYVEQGKARADLTVDFVGEFGAGVPVLKASGSDTSLESYIAVIPGEQLANIYDKWGARLLESNVRSFLQAKGKVNQGIKRTIVEEPHMFLAYNNGLAATAERIELEQTPDGLVITSADNLQIVNGGQTTASIHSTRKLAGEGIKDIFVQMKLNIVPTILADTVVPRISEYANSQNKVNAADFFANHPFHVKIEELSRKVLAPAGADGYRETKWFYERARGQYADQRSKLSDAEKKRWDAVFPRRQFFTKTDLAKFENSWAGRPDKVSEGAQKNFVAFAKTIEKAWGQNGDRINESWFRQLISKAIIFRKLEKLVSAQDWYEGGYRANIVTYSIAKLSYDANELEKVIDLHQIWRFQDIPVALERTLMVAAAEAQQLINSPPDGIKNMSEWAKKQACWEQFRNRKLSYPEEFTKMLVDPEVTISKDREITKDEDLTKGIEAEKEILNLGAAFWERAKIWGRERKLVSPSEFGVLDHCSRIPARLPTEKQALFALTVIKKLEENGFSKVD